MDKTELIWLLYQAMCLLQRVDSFLTGDRIGSDVWVDEVNEVLSECETLRVKLGIDDVELPEFNKFMKTVVH